MKFHHIGVISKSIEKHLEKLARQYDIIETSSIVFDTMQNARVCMVYTTHNINIELIEGDVVKNLAKRGIEYYHICYEVDDLDKSTTTMLEKGAQLVAPPKPAILFEGRRVAFLYTTLGLIELLEKNKHAGIGE